MTPSVTNATLSRQDWIAAGIGVADATCGCREPAAPREDLTPLARAMLWLVGDRAPRPLANPRLEAIRRFVCATRAGHHPAAALMSELHRVGVQPAHLAAIVGFLN